MEYSKEFKEALSNLSSIEKDRLIFRLLKKDKLLSKKLYFELIDQETTDEKRNQMEKLIEKKVSSAAKYIGQGYFLPDIKTISAEITEHTKVTTDKYGEVSLNLLLVEQILNHNEKLKLTKLDLSYKLYIYIINKIVKALLLTKKLDEDYYIEIDEYLTKIKEQILENFYLEKLFINNGLNFNWLQCENIPDNFDSIIKDIKNKGFLK